MVVTVVLLYQDNIYYSSIVKGEEITIGSGKKDKMSVKEFLPEQIAVKWKKNGFFVDAKKAYGFDKTQVPLDSLILLSKKRKTVLYLSSVTSVSTESLKLPYDCILKVGRAEDNDIIINLPFVSSTHFTIKKEGSTVRVEDQDSTNGLFLNGKKVGIAKMKSGDVLSILSARIKLLNGVLYFENVGNHLSVGEIQDLFDNTQHIDKNEKELVYRRSPRTQDRLPTEDIILASAPTKGQKFEKNRGMFASLAGTGAMFAANMFTAAASPALVAARAASLVSPAASLASSKGMNKRRKMNLEEYEAMRLEKYGAYIQDQKSRIESVASVQRNIITHENPTPKECLNILYGLKRNLFERMPEDRDFLDIRIGMGYEDLCVSVKSRTDNNGFQMEDDEVRELSEQIIEETRIVDNVPSRISLLTKNTVGFIGNRKKTINLVRNMIISLATLHCGDDVKIIGIFDEEELNFWESLKWLPHIWDDNLQTRTLSFDKENAHNICEIYDEIIKKRALQHKESYGKKSINMPFYIFIFGSKEMVKDEEIMNNLFYNEPSMGVTSLFLFDDMYMLPNSCEYIVDSDNGPCAYLRNEANKRIYFTADENTDDIKFDNFTRRMSAIKLEGFSQRSQLPDSITFLKGYGVKKVEELDVLKRWNSALTYKSLAAPIGVMTGNKVFNFDIHENKHGPHGLVAGTTGSGKSELVQTWILSMAISYHPHEVSFVIIDYKGGGMANLLEPLPHVVGKITNISSNISRSLVSLQSEIKRRYAVFDKYGVNHIDKYQKLYKSGVAKEPMPHLIIVSDEFAELKKEEPEFMAGLVSAARVGRSLGVHLVLATQKPGGVVDDQIQSNSKFRLCLKVQDIADSREMIKRPDAAHIVQAGRAYIRVGEDEYFDLFQSYWSGAPYLADEKTKEDMGNSVYVIDINGRRIKPVTAKTKRSESDVDELKAIVDYICKTASDNGIKRLQGPWLPELTEELYVNDICPFGETEFGGWDDALRQEWLKVPIGMYDMPVLQEQGTQFIDFASEGHYAIYGAPGTGKTTLLKTIALSLGINYTPEDVNIYILDCGGWSMSVFANMPHVGGVALDGEDEKFSKFEKLIVREFELRKSKFLKNSVSSLTAYRESVGGDMPAIVIMVDNIVSLFELYPDMELFFTTIAREGATYGIYLIYTANSTTGVRYKVLQNIRGAIAFELTDKGDYPAIVGRLDGKTLPKISGRAFYKGNPPVEFQAAMFSKGGTDKEKNAAVKEIINRMNSLYSGKKPKPIPVMPENVTYNDMLSEYTKRTMIPVGICCEDICNTCVDLSDRYSLLIVGSQDNEKKRLAENINFMVASAFPDTKIFVFDSLNKSLENIKDKAYKYAGVESAEEVSEMLGEIVKYLNERKNAQNRSKQVEGDSFDEKAFIKSYEMIFINIGDLKEFVDTVSDADKNTMERICRLAQNLGVIVMAMGTGAEISKYNEIESLTRCIVACQNGVVLDGTPAQHGYFQNNLKYTERDNEAGEGYSYLFVNGKCQKIKSMK